MPAALTPPGNLSGAFMSGASPISNIIRRAGSRRPVTAKIVRLGIAACALSAPLMLIQAMAPAAEAAQLNATARIQALLDNPVNGVVNLPSGTFTIRPALRLKQAEKIIGHHTTLRVAGSSGDYTAVLGGASAGTDLSGLTITGVTFDQNTSGNPIRNVSALYRGQPRFVILVSRGTGISITNNKFLNTNNVDTVRDDLRKRVPGPEHATARPLLGLHLRNPHHDQRQHVHRHCHVQLSGNRSAR